MNSDEKEKLVQEIEKNITELKDRIVELEISTKAIPPDSALGRLTRIDAMQMKAVGEVGLANVRQELEALERQLEKINTADFGICPFCKGEIGIERLKALPGTDKCIKCAEKYS